MNVVRMISPRTTAASEVVTPYLDAFLLLRAGIVHFSHNPFCQPAQFLANFGERDPGETTGLARMYAA